METINPITTRRAHSLAFGTAWFIISLTEAFGFILGMPKNGAKGKQNKAEERAYEEEVVPRDDEPPRFDGPFFLRRNRDKPRQ